MKTNKTSVQATAKSNILQADPILLSVITKLTECRVAIEAYCKAVDDGLDFIDEKADIFDRNVFSCISIMGDMIGFQIANNALNLCSHE